METYMNVEKWLVKMKESEEHDYNVLQSIANKDSLEGVAIFIEGCLVKYGGSKTFAVLEYCANNLTHRK